MAFQAYLGEYTSIPVGSTVIFDQVYTNLGNGYDVTTGLFTVPPGGGGLYYFYVHFSYEPSEFSRYTIRVNGAIRCSTRGNYLNSGAYGSSSCSIPTVVQEGKRIHRLHNLITHGLFVPLKY